ncbi:MAG: chemotaxis protein CheA, partial [Myxococcota bacterium]
RSAFMLARMVPVAEMLQRVPLLVRQMAASSGKLVKLRIDVGQVELDKGVSDRVFPAVVHLLRNAIDHGIETPEHREHAGKPREGRLSVTCIERGSSLLELTVEDDGSGIDAVHVASAAHAPVPEDTHGLLDVLTSPGFSTSRTVTHTSGRGFGMNIVRDIAVNQLRGQLTLRTTPGSGSAFTLLMPLTLSIIDAFSFCCSDQFFVVPVSMVERVVEIEPRHVLPVPSDKQGEEQRLHLLSYRDDVVPLISLGDLLGLEHRQSQMRTALVVRRDEDAFAFEVDRLVGQHEAVVRPLDDALLRVAGVSGAADLGNGVPTLVLDLVALAESFDGSPQEIAR